ncbi:primosomal protein DnaT [Buchnera aphidicola]|jgi:DNA replication protein DnaT|uniref:Replication restart protein DnaT n=1 Tax=Buchnera aphidicola subsp. Schizaphis graminum (strain Sg) TaxID=198804 RepID=DNAT_BUCAP|nr:primosomal protein DnaT [Buchnera aphidicola]Q8KA78.1 RecName: Full=Primosomal protein 1; AltName: Full=Primosomal protein I [Buchnera aphidicola str. Sg (Schizaphis graminum)]AAM67595.1 primosomal protein I [Buchnera aphidicola str. Sg (Schizaphis graminum)]AWI49903.1 primosomal protein DnaT [Buchnera aphidicola (Schizaphis graminum)]
MKILVSKKITLDLFCKNPIQIIEKEKNEIISISKNKKTVFYVIQPKALKKLFDIKEYFVKSKITKKEKKIIEKFPMHTNWIPDKDFIQKAALWGISLNEEVSKYELASFISYWEAEGLFFHHIQWQQKLARSLERSRSMNNAIQQKKDITYIPVPDQKTPDGFRGK